MVKCKKIRKNNLFRMRMRIVIICFILIAVFSNVAKAQIDIEFSDSTINQEVDYVKSYSDLLVLRIHAVNKFNKFELKDDISKNKIKYSPNGNYNLGFGFNYKWLGLNVAFDLPFLNDDDDIYGTTERFDLVTNIYGRKFVLDASLSTYKGFYNENPEDLYKDWDKEKKIFPQRSDIKTSTIGGSFYYILNNKRFSYRASFVQNEVQLKSAGSLILGSSLFNRNIEGDSCIVPDALRDSFGDKNHIVKIGSTDMGFSVGYIYTLVIRKRFFATLSFVPGLLIQSVDAETTESEDNFSSSSFSFKNNTRAAIGYTNGRFFSSLTFINDNFKLATPNNAHFNYELGQLRLAVGTRLNVNKKKTKNK